jgi:DNA-directed RNA polymerase subunit M/transcription elongation factor TFIIS
MSNVRQAVFNRIHKILIAYPPIANSPFIKFVEKLCVDIETSILNQAMLISQQHGIKTRYEEEDFQYTYQNIVYTILSNLDPNSSLNSHYDSIQQFESGVIPPYPTSPLIEQFYSYLKLQHSLSSLVRDGHMTPELQANICNYIVNPSTLASLPPSSYNPTAYQDQINDYDLRCNEHVEEKYSTLYKCNNCHNRKTTSKLVQTRALDEPLTNFITCFYCKNVMTM